MGTDCMLWGPALQGQSAIRLVPGAHLAPSRPNLQPPNLCSNWPPHQGRPFHSPESPRSPSTLRGPAGASTTPPAPTRLRGLPTGSIDQTTLC